MTTHDLRSTLQKGAPVFLASVSISISIVLTKGHSQNLHSFPFSGVSFSFCTKTIAAQHIVNMLNNTIFIAMKGNYYVLKTHQPHKKDVLGKF